MILLFISTESWPMLPPNAVYGRLTFSFFGV